MDTGDGKLSDAEMAVMVALGCSATEACARYAEMVPALALLQFPGPCARGLVTAEPVLNLRARPALGSAVVAQLATDQVILLYGQTADALRRMAGRGAAAGRVGGCGVCKGAGRMSKEAARLAERPAARGAKRERVEPADS